MHPYLQGLMENAVLVEPALQQGRKSPSLAAAPGTPVAEPLDAERAPAVTPAEPSTPAANGIDPSGACAEAAQVKGTEGETGQDTGVEGGNRVEESNHVPAAAQPSQPGTREASVDCSSMAYSMDCSAGSHCWLSYLAWWHDIE